MNEAETRAEHVDPTLKAAGWGAVWIHPIPVPGADCEYCRYRVSARDVEET